MIQFFTPKKNELIRIPGSGILLSLHFIFLERIHAHDSLENQLWAQSEFPEAKGFSQENSSFSLFWQFMLCRAEGRLSKLSPYRDSCVTASQQKFIVSKKRVAGLRELASKLLQDNYKSWQAPSALPTFLFSLCGPQPPHKAICLRSCWERANKVCCLCTRLQKATCPTPQAVQVAMHIWVKALQSTGPRRGIINRFVSQCLSS